MNKIFHFKSYFKFLSRNKAYTIIEVFGLSVSLMFIILIGIYTQQEFSVDKMHSKAERIYALGRSGNGEESIGSHHAIQPRLLSRYPQIEATCAINKQKSKVSLPTGEKLSATFLFVDSTFYKLFDFKLLEGDRNTVLNAPNSAVITEDFARKLFGNIDPVGKNIKWRDSINFVVTGVAEEMKNSCIRDIDILVRFENLKYISNEYISPDMSNAVGSDVFILARPNTDLLSKTEDMKSYFKTFFWLYRLKDMAEGVNLTSLNKLYFSSRESDSGNTDRGDKKLVDILFAVGLVILLFSMMNYINLTVAQAGFRAKEMATRRLLGSFRKEIMLRLILESILLCVISLAVGLLLAFVFAPYADHLLHTTLYMGSVFMPGNLLIILLLVFVIGSVAGIMPAIVLSAAKPIEVVRGTFRRKTKMVFSKIFITFQNAITIVMIAVSITMICQIRHLINAPLGYNKENIITINNLGDSTKVRTFINELRQQACVKDVSATQGTPFNRGNNNTMTYQGKTISFQVFRADSSFMSIYGLKLIRNNHLDDENGVYVNKQALTEMGLNMDAESIMLYDKPYPIRGIVRNFHLGDITTKEHPVMISIKKEISWPWAFVIQVTGNPVEAYQQVQKVYKEVYDETLTEDNPYTDQKIENNFESQIRVSKIIMLFAAIAILISLLGLLAMSTYFIQQHGREIAVRKVFGSSSREIWIKLIRTFLSYVVIAFVVAVPVIYYFMNDWLSSYSYRIHLSPWIFIVSGLFCLIVSFVTVFIQSYHAANVNPVESIKNN